MTVEKYAVGISESEIKEDFKKNLPDDVVIEWVTPGKRGNIIYRGKYIKSFQIGDYDE